MLPHFAGLEFAYTSIDAVYIWTRGGYQVACNPDDYPLYIEINETDLSEWERFFKSIAMFLTNRADAIVAVRYFCS